MSREREERPTSNVDILHVSLGDLIADLLNQSQGELHIVRLAGLGVDVPSTNKIQTFSSKVRDWT